MRAKKQAIPSVVPEQGSIRQIGNWFVGPAEERNAAQRAVEAMRGSALLLDSFAEGCDNTPGLSTTLMGLAEVLYGAADELDAVVFNSAGTIARSLPPRATVALLERELQRAKAKAAKEEAR